MFSRLALPKRLPINAAFAGKRAPLSAAVRFNSTSSASAQAQAARVVEMARTVQKPSALEASVPVMWVLSGAAIYAAFKSVEKSGVDHVEKLLIV